MKGNKKENTYYCFRYKCKLCPKQAECEKENRKEASTIERQTNTKTREVYTKHSKWYEPKGSIQERI